jgi:hypothetical protein
MSVQNDRVFREPREAITEQQRNNTFGCDSEKRTVNSLLLLQTPKMPWLACMVFSQAFAAPCPDEPSANGLPLHPSLLSFELCGSDHNSLTI